jgi:glucose-6-phosphate-specific signal transduction histidine kinase
MLNRKTRIYIGAWLSYILFSFSLFPAFNITVMLFSIPLTMLGAWYYHYRGALITILLTIGCHYVMLKFHAADSAIVLEAFNPFGIGSQLCFSFFTALLKSSDERYSQLNNSLERMITERTEDLRMLTDYLISAGESERINLEKSLIEGPYESMAAMLNTSQKLNRRFEQTCHAELPKAETITFLIQTCMDRLQSLQSSGITETGDLDVHRLIRRTADYFHAISGARFELHIQAECEHLDREKVNHIHHIIHEAVSNALRHAEATHIVIGMSDEKNACRVYVENNGHPMPEAATTGMGLPLMKYRAERIGATFSILAEPGRKTRVECIIPRHQE